MFFRRYLVNAFTIPLMLILVNLTNAQEVSISLTQGGLAPNAQETQIFFINLATTGVSSFDQITLTDDNNAAGGGQGIFSGFDVDAVIFDLDGNLGTEADRLIPDNFVFNAGTTRPPQNSGELPTAEHPGPTFGSLSSTEIDFDTATLSEFDAVFDPNASVDANSIANGFLTLGDGGSLSVTFDNTVGVGGDLFLFVGDVAANESLGLQVTVSSSIPEPSPSIIFLLATSFIVQRRYR